MGWYSGDLARLVWQSRSVRGGRQRRPVGAQPTNTVGHRLGAVADRADRRLARGSYLLRLDAEDGAQRFVPLTIRSPGTAGRVVIKNSTATWQAYNMWGGYDLYNGRPGWPTTTTGRWWSAWTGPTT